MFRILGNKWSCHLLYYFADTASVTATTDELVTHLIQHETTAGPDDTTRVKTELHHKHFPKLAAAGVIDYDPRDETVRYHDGTPLEAVETLAARME
ncbi:DUF7344 domain-containing protein [Haladaptatus halobius]|uniref:DUF7344 domain-containing protein n=1 Tax=Haladaptatus halobius TaxID=2884875 RepID=UPI001D0A8020|nr:hypothetical protein [Haladaptatus halobius]